MRTWASVCWGAPKFVLRIEEVCLTLKGRIHTFTVMAWFLVSPRGLDFFVILGVATSCAAHALKRTLLPKARNSLGSSCGLHPETAGTYLSVSGREIMNLKTLTFCCLQSCNTLRVRTGKFSSTVFILDRNPFNVFNVEGSRYGRKSNYV